MNHYLEKIALKRESIADWSHYPFSLPVIKNLQNISFPSQVTFFVGENGSGKSTLLEALAEKANFGSEGGSKNINFKTADITTYTAADTLAQVLTCSWRLKPKDGYFFRSETFYNLASKIDDIGGGIHSFYGNKSLHVQSHGESFLALFQNRIGKGGFFLFDEPEAALSPERQLSLLAIIYELCQEPSTQFIIATHSPILLAYPGSTIYSFDSETVQKIEYKETSHYRITKSFLDNPDRYFKTLFEK